MASISAVTTSPSEYSQVVSSQKGSFNADKQAAKAQREAGEGAIENLNDVSAPSRTGNQLKSVESRLQSISSPFGGGQLDDGLNLLA